jgi:hypothetical protein
MGGRKPSVRQKRPCGNARAVFYVYADHLNQNKCLTLVWQEGTYRAFNRDVVYFNEVQ